MSHDMQKPILASVLALEVLGDSSQPADAQLPGLLRHLHALNGQHCSLQLQARGSAGKALTLIMPPDVQVGSALRRSLTAIEDFEQATPGSRVCALIHHGVVFAAHEGGQAVHVGSAVRLAHSALRRLEGSQRLAASADFFQHARDWANSPLRFTALSGAAAAEGLQALSLSSEEAAPSALNQDDDALREFLNARLAAEVGPFASVLVEAARRVAPSASALVLELAQEIESHQGRDDFTREGLAWIQARQQT